MLRSLVTRGYQTIEMLLTQLQGRERGQTMIESAMVLGFLSIVAITIFSAMGDATTGMLSGVHEAFASSGSDASVQADAFQGPRIAD
jgi:Flp pilus assembly pilin Flp